MELKIFTLNCWGIPVVSTDRKARMQAIAEELAKCQYDIVCLQEVWTDSDFFLIRDKAIGTLPHAHYFYSGVIGSGVCILSKYPIQEVFFHKWMVNGYVHKIQHADWFGGKGVGLCRVKVNEFNVNIYSAHLHAEYNRQCDEYQAHRVLQAFDTAQFIQLTSSCADLVVLAGDLNTEPGDLAYRILTHTTSLKDAFMEIDEVPENSVGTNEELKNSYTSKALIKKQIHGKRIDYIMYHVGSNVVAQVEKYGQPFADRVPNCDYSYSDHEAIAATLTISRNEIPMNVVEVETYKSTLHECVAILDEGLSSLINHRRLYWLLTVLMLILMIVTFITNPPFGCSIIYHIIRILLTGILCYTFIMATLWNMIETNSMLAGKLAMEVALKFLTQKN